MGGQVGRILGIRDVEADGGGVAASQALDAPQGGDVEQQASGDDLGQGLDPEPVGPVLLDDVDETVTV